MTTSLESIDIVCVIFFVAKEVLFLQLDVLQFRVRNLRLYLHVVGYLPPNLNANRLNLTLWKSFLLFVSAQFKFGIVKAG